MMPGRGKPSPVNDNLSSLNPEDAKLQFASGQIRPDMTIREFFQGKGIDVDGPISQLTDFLGQQKQMADPMMKMRKIAADTALQKGGQPPTMPGVKPMVSPPDQPSPAGLQGLMNRMGGQ
jgi:hypothetical protein